MTTFLMIRHGQSQANLDACFAGHLNIPLTPLGERQASLTAAYVAGKYHVDAIYASDLLRAYNTAVPLGEKLGLDVIPQENLREISAGEWEGAPFARLDAEDSEAWRIWREDVGRAVCPGGESAAQLQQRILGALRAIAAENDGKTVVIATHATPVRTVQCHAAGLPIERLREIPWVPNASVTVIEYEDGCFRLISAGEAAHLGELTTALPANV